MEAGQLTRRITIQAQSTQQDSFGQELTTWTNVYTCWASIDVQSSQLLYSTAEFMSKVAYRITIRWTSSVIVATSMRVLYTEPTTQVQHTYELQAVLNEKNQNKWLILMAYELEGAE